MLTCTSGLISVQDIVDGVNENETAIGNVDAKVTVNSEDIAENSEDIGLIDTRVTTLESGSGTGSPEYQALDARITQNEFDIASNDTDIAANALDIGTNAGNIAANTGGVATNITDIAALDSRVTILESGATTNESRITQNESDIAALQAGSSVDIGAALYVHQVTDGSGGGSSNATWTFRNVSTQIYDTLSCVNGGTSITPPAGEYNIFATAMGEGSVHQSRLNIDGSHYNGTLVSNSGNSTMSTRATLSGLQAIAVETIVETPVATTGFGAASPFAGEAANYVLLYIEKVG